MPQPERDRRLAHEQLDEARVVRQLVANRLDGHGLAAVRARRDDGLPHLSYPASRDPRHDRIFTVHEARPQTATRRRRGDLDRPRALTPVPLGQTPIELGILEIPKPSDDL